MVDRFEQEERYGPDSTFVKRARFNQTIEPYRSTEVPAKPGVKPHWRVRELPAFPVREHQQDSMLQQQDNMLQQQDDMLQDEVVNFGQHVKQHPLQQQLQLRQHHIPHNLLQMHYTSRTIWYSRLFISGIEGNCARQQFLNRTNIWDCRSPTH